jgi:dihydroflavonol-4-reductase
LKVKKPKFYASKWITEIAWRLNWITSEVFNQKRKISKDSARSSHSASLYSNEKVRNKFNYQFKNMNSYILEIARFYSSIS